jgi:monothiol glutaredoxin
MDDALKSRIQGIIDEHPIVLFMKGTKNFPQCGFSATVVEVMKRMDADFHHVNVLEDPEIRQGIKEFTNWPTIPQLYVKGEFVGGCDIVRDMYMSGELTPVVDKALDRQTADAG